MSLFGRINIKSIVKNHIGTFYHYGEKEWSGKNKVPLSDVFLFLIVPILVATILLLLKVELDKEFISLIITSLSILIGLLFGVLTMIFDLVKSEQVHIESKDIRENAKKRLIKELFINISFEIALSIITIISILFTSIKSEILYSWISKLSCTNIITHTYKLISHFVTYFLISLFVLTLLMILKRFFILFNEQLNQTPKT